MLIQRFVRVRQADQDEVERLMHQGLTQRFVTIEVIAQDRDEVGTIRLGVSRQPAFCRRDLTVLLGVSILRHNELRH